MEIGTFVKQYKGKDLGKVPKSKLLEDGWYVGIKYDGNYCQIHKKGQQVWMFTSSGEPFTVRELLDELLTIPFDFIIEAEFNNNSDGLKLNDRRKSSTGTPRADFKKGIITSMPDSQLRVFDILWRSNSHITPREYRSYNFKQRNELLVMFDINLVRPVGFKSNMTLKQAQAFARGIISQGGEGAFAFHETHTIKDKGRSNLAIKLKADNRAIMVCIGADVSETVECEWGALKLQDNKGNIQSFGGLSDKIRKYYPFVPTGSNFEVRYESFTDGKYIQGFISE